MYPGQLIKLDSRGPTGLPRYIVTSYAQPAAPRSEPRVPEIETIPTPFYFPNRRLVCKRLSPFH